MNNAVKPSRRRKAVRHLFRSLGLATAICAINAQANIYEDRFHELRDEIYNPENGFLSADGGPYHAIETLNVEAPDHGHQSTSEAYSYILWLEAVHGRLTGDWQPLVDAWTLIEEHIIPTSEMQPGASNYDPSSPATYIPESGDPSGYPGPLLPTVPVGEDPVSAELAQTYGTWEIYGMHWLLDMDNVYGYGNLGDGVSTPSYINTFQRGEQESVWETVTHPSWEDFTWGNDYGFLQLFVDEEAPAEQWRYTNAPDADARAVQVMYWALQWMDEQGVDPEQVAPGLMAKAAKMGDYLRLAMFDKYFKAMGTDDPMDPAGSGYDSAHYLMSWYYSWGGPIDTSQSWGFRIGASHVHFGYQNPMAGYALTQIPELEPASPNAVRDWGISLERTLEFYQWLQSAEGGIAGGATNSWNGSYDARPAGAPEFYGMTYDDNPVYHDPSSGTWFGWQAWSVERLCEYYYVTGDARAEAILDKWVPWVLSPEVTEFIDGDVYMASTLEWSGAPEDWNPANPADNTNLHVTVVNKGQDVGVIHNTAKALMYYAAGKREHTGTTHEPARAMAQQILDTMWNLHRDDKGIATVESRGDYIRFFDPVYVPEDYEGVMANGDAVNSDSTFFSIRTFYEDDPLFQRVRDAYDQNGDGILDDGPDGDYDAPEFTYHRYWATVDAATANAIYAELFPVVCTENCPPTASPVSAETAVNQPVTVTLMGSDPNGNTLTYSYTQPANGMVSGSGAEVTYVPQSGFVGADGFTYTVTDDEGLTSEPASVSLTVYDPNANEPPTLSLSATMDYLELSASASATDPEGDALSFSWDLGDGNTATGSSVTHTYGDAGTYVVSVSVSDGVNTVSDSTTVTAEAPPEGECHVDYVMANAWGGSYQVDLTITNTGTETIAGYSLDWTLANGAQFASGWNASFNASGSQVTASNPASQWNGTLQPGQSGSFGFIGEGSFGIPASFVLNGTNCTGGDGGGDVNLPPTASFSYSVDGLNLSVSGAGSSDPDGDALTYSWDFGDGTTATGLDATHSYATDGNYTVTLSVSDGELDDSTSLNVTISTEEPNQPPVAAFSSSVDALCVSVDGSASSDPDGDALSFAWDFGDGSSATGATAEHCYAASGSYDLSLEVSDGTLDDSASETVTVSSGGGGGNVCEFDITNNWGSGFTAMVRITNNGDTPINGWEVSWAFPPSYSVTNSWNGNVSSSNPYTATNLSWNAVIQPGQSVEVGVQGAGSGTFTAPEVTGAVCD